MFYKPPLAAEGRPVNMNLCETFSLDKDNGMINFHMMSGNSIEWKFRVKTHAINVFNTIMRGNTVEFDRNNSRK